MQHIRAVEKKIQQQQRADEIEVGVADDGEPERTVAAHRAQLPPDFGGEIGGEFFLRICRRNFRYAKTGNESGNRQRDQEEAGNPLFAAQFLRQDGGGDRAEDDGHERAEFEDAVAPRELPLGQ